MSLHDDLARWEAGSLSREDLLAAYPSSDKNLAEPNLTGVLDLHDRLTELGSEPVPYHEWEWDELRAKLPDRLPQRLVFGGGRLARPLIAASMVVGLTAGAAAASPTVRHRIVSVWQDVQHMVGMDDDRSAEAPNGTATIPTVDGSQDSAGTGVIGSPRPQSTPNSEDTAAPSDESTGSDEPATEEPPSPSGGGTPGGDTPGGDTPDGDTPGGETPGGETPGGETPGGETPGGDTPGGDTPGGTPGGGTPGGDTPDGDTPGGDTPGGDTPGGETPDGDTLEGPASSPGPTPPLLF